jgi:hypothetical protein
MTRLFALLAALFALVAATSPAAAWWEYGHETVARTAYLEVMPATRAGIDALLRQSKLLDTPSCPARTIEQASVWPDCVKTLGDRFSYAYSWHFVDIDVCKPFDPKGRARAETASSPRSSATSGCSPTSTSTRASG